MNFANFFKDKDGKVVIGQFPNWPIFAILALYIGRSLFDSLNTEIGYAIVGLWIFWGAWEVYAGVNLFRKTLGLIVIGFNLWSLIQ